MVKEDTAISKKDVLLHLLTKHHKKKQQTSIRVSPTAEKPTFWYKKYGEHDADIVKENILNELIEELVSLDWIKADKHKYSRNYKRVLLNPTEIRSIENYLMLEHAIVPYRRVKEDVIKYFKNNVRRGPLTEKYIERKLLEMKEVYEAKGEYLQETDKLRILDFFQNNKTKIYEREMSQLLFGNTKTYENNYKNNILSILKEINNEDYEWPEEAEEKYFVYPTPQEILIKGDIVITFHSGHELYATSLHGGLCITSEDLNDIKTIAIHSDSFVTIENKTAYYRYEKENASMMYLGGFATRYQIQFLRKVLADNPNCEYLHFGDIDIGGFTILSSLCDKTGISFIPLYMNSEQLISGEFREYAQKICDTDGRTEKLKETKYAPDVLYIETNQIRLEQEIVAMRFSETLNNR